jgi:hypothetical protein
VTQLAKDYNYYDPNRKEDKSTKETRFIKTSNRAILGYAIILGFFLISNFLPNPSHLSLTILTVVSVLLVHYLPILKKRFTRKK